jgi:hypothetical protein
MVTPTTGRRNFVTTFRNMVASGGIASQFRFLHARFLLLRGERAASPASPRSFRSLAQFGLFATLESVGAGSGVEEPRARRAVA